MSSKRKSSDHQDPEEGELGACDNRKHVKLSSREKEDSKETGDKEKRRSQEREKDRDIDRKREKERDREKEKERERDKDREKERRRSRDADSERDRRDREKERDRHHRSSRDDHHREHESRKSRERNEKEPTSSHSTAKKTDEKTDSEKTKEQKIKEVDIEYQRRVESQLAEMEKIEEEEEVDPEEARRRRREALLARARSHAASAAEPTAFDISLAPQSSTSSLASSSSTSCSLFSTSSSLSSLSSPSVSSSVSSSLSSCPSSISESSSSFSSSSVSAVLASSLPSSSSSSSSSASAASTFSLSSSSLSSSSVHSTSIAITKGTASPSSEIAKKMKAQTFALMREQLEKKLEEERKEKEKKEKEEKEKFKHVKRDEYDMFSDSPPPITAKVSSCTSSMSSSSSSSSSSSAAASGSMLDTWDDNEGYYLFRSGDVLASRYQVYASQGRGVFSTVLRVRDLQGGGREYVVKVIRNNETMLKAGLKELEVCRTLAEADPENKKHCVRLISHFEHRSHLCLVFEAMNLNLREVLKKFGGVGLSIVAVKAYAKQLFIALRHLKRCSILHGDLKPDNMLVNESMNIVKLCDFGSAAKLSECEITPFLFSRFYRPPEVMLGLPYDESADMWAVGCILFELYTGKIAFPGETNNEMLRLQQDLMGPVPAKLIKKSQFKDEHYDSDNVFQFKVIDPVTQYELTKKLKILRPQKELTTILLNASSAGSGSGGRLSDSERRKVIQLADLIRKVFVPNPADRLTVDKALVHPFLKDG